MAPPPRSRPSARWSAPGRDSLWGARGARRAGAARTPVGLRTRKKSPRAVLDFLGPGRFLELARAGVHAAPALRARQTPTVCPAPRSHSFLQERGLRSRGRPPQLATAVRLISKRH